MASKDDNDILTFKRLTESIEVTFRDEPAFLCVNLDEAVKICVTKAQRYGRASTLTLGITFKPSDGRMLVAAKLLAKFPEPQGQPISAFVDRAGRLVSEDPRQGNLPIEIVKKEHGK